MAQGGHRMGEEICIRHYLGRGPKGAVGLLEMNGQGAWRLVVLPGLDREFVQRAVLGRFKEYLTRDEVKRDGRIIFRLRRRPTVDLMRRLQAFVEDVLSAGPASPFSGLRISGLPRRSPSAVRIKTRPGDRSGA